MSRKSRLSSLGWAASVVTIILGLLLLVSPSSVFRLHTVGNRALMSASILALPLGLAWNNLRDSPRLATSCRMDPRTLRSNRCILEKAHVKTDRSRTNLRTLPAQERSSQPPQIPALMERRARVSTEP